MKLYLRIILNVPLIVFATVRLVFHNPDIQCFGMLDIFLTIAFYLLLFLFVALAFIGSVWKRKAGQTSFEPFSLGMLVISSLVLAWVAFYPGHSTGTKYLYAEGGNDHHFTKKALTLRTNGNYTLNEASTDIGCEFSGRYFIRRDTIFLGDPGADEITDHLTPTYIVKTGQLIPLAETGSSTVLTIK